MLKRVIMGKIDIKKTILEEKRFILNHPSLKPSPNKQDTLEVK